jgi:hypothetical protein
MTRSGSPSWRGDACAASAANWPRRCKVPCGTITASRLTSQLRQLDFYDTQIAELDQEIARRLGVQLGPDDPELQGGGPTSVQPVSSADPVPDGGADLAARAPQRSADPARSQAEVMAVLDEVTGINQRVAQIVVADLGIRLDQFRSSGHLLSWA